MKRKRHSAEQIISKLREAEVLLEKGQAVPQVCRQLGVTAQTYYRWRKETMRVYAISSSSAAKETRKICG